MNFEEYRDSLFSLGATTALGARLEADNVEVDANIKYLRGDHWQNGDGWVGPPVPSDISSRDQVLQGVLRDFTSVPLIEEIVGRHVTGLVGREPAFELLDDATAEARKNAPSREEAKKIVPPQEVQQANDLLTRWFDEQDIKHLLDEYAAHVAATGRSVVRVWVPREYLGDKGEVIGPNGGKPTLEEALDMVCAEVVNPKNAGILTHRRSMRRFGIAVLDALEREADSTGEIQDIPLNMIEVQWVEKGQTIIRVARGSDDKRQVDTIAVDADSALLIYEGIRRKGPLITEPVRRLQASIDMLASMLPRNAKYAGFRERHFFGVQEPRDKDTGVALPVQLGAGVPNFWKGVVYPKEDGTTGVMPASLVTGEPVDSAPIRADMQALSLAMLRSTRQLHAAMGDDATASGVSRVQAMADFIDSLNDTRPAVEGMLRWLIKTVLLVACTLSEDVVFAGQVKAMRARVDCKLPAGNLSPEEKTALIGLVNARLMSEETAMTANGIEDVDAESAKIAEERKLREQGEGDPNSF